MLGKILSSPKEMEKIGKMASELFGGGDAGTPPEGSMPDLGKMLASFGGGGGGDKAALVAALAPYLKPERRRKLEKALKISRLAGIAEFAMNGMGEGNV